MTKQVEIDRDQDIFESGNAWDLDAQLNNLKETFKKKVIVRGTSDLGSMSDLSDETDYQYRTPGDPTVYHLNIKRLAHMVDNTLIMARSLSGISLMVEYWNAPIIWTFECGTACTDGIRIAFNPLFAQHLIGEDPTTEAREETKEESDDPLTSMKKVMPLFFIIVHETYHQIYRHPLREKLKGVPSSLHVHANIAQDAEINRDIESDYPAFFKGMTNYINGIIGTPEYPNQEWEYIYDQILEDKWGRANEFLSNLQDEENQSKSRKKQQGQQGQTGQSGQGQQGQQGQSGQSGQGSSQGQSGQQGNDGGPEQSFGSGGGVGSSQQQDDQSNQQGMQQGQGGISQQGDQQGQGSDEGNNDEQSNDDYKKGQIDAYKDAISEKPKSKSGNAAYEKGYQDAKEQINQAKENAGKGVHDEQDQSSSTFGADRVSKEEMDKLADDAGQSYKNDTSETDADKKAKGYIDEHRDALDKIGSGSPYMQKGRGFGAGSMKERLRKIDDMFKPKIVWKSRLRRIFNAIVPAGRRWIRSKPLISQNRMDRYNAVNPQEYKKREGIAQVLYLVDNSGSMFQNTYKVFDYIMSEIIELEKSCRVKTSAFTYFTDGIHSENLKLWHDTTSKAKIKEMIASQPSTGGTNMVKGLYDVMALKKPYFSKQDPGTVVITFTDGDDDYSKLKEFPWSFRKNLVFIVITPDGNHDAAKNLNEGGIQETNIMYISSNEVLRNAK